MRYPQVHVIPGLGAEELPSLRTAKASSLAGSGSAARASAWNAGGSAAGSSSTHQTSMRCNGSRCSREAIAEKGIDRLRITF